MSGAGQKPIAALVLALAVLPAFGGTCSVSSNGLAFGSYQPLTFGSELSSTAATGLTTVSLACTGIVAGAAYSLALGPSTVGNSFRPRYLAHAGGGPAMAYNVYRDAGYTSIWGDGTDGSLVTGTLPPGDSAHTHIGYGHVPAGQRTLRPGSFTGSLVLTITYSP